MFSRTKISFARLTFTLLCGSVLVFSLPLDAAAQAQIPSVPTDFRITQVLDNLPGANLFTFDFEDNFIFAETTNNVTKIVKVTPAGEATPLLDRYSLPLLALSFHGGKVYLISNGTISTLDKGHIRDIVTGLPAEGDYANGNVIFQDGKMYFGVGTVTNSGIVGADNTWLAHAPSIHDLPCTTVKINQVNIQTDNFLTKKKGDTANTGSFMPFNTSTYGDTIFGSYKCNGAIMRANPDGSNLEVYAWGLHNPKGLSFDALGHLYTLDQGMEDRGARPVKGGVDSLYEISQGTWYGWPDYSAGQALDNPLIKDIPNIPPAPIASFDPGHLTQLTVSPFVKNIAYAISDNKKVVQLNLSKSDLKDFLTLASDKEQILQMKTGPDNNLYVLTSDGKVSKLWKIESLTHAVASGSTHQRTAASRNWTLSIATMLIGIGAVYFVHRNQQRTI